MKESSKKKIKWIILVIVGLILVSISSVVIAVLIAFNQIHVNIDFIDYESEYVVPDLPSDIIETSVDPNDFDYEEPEDEPVVEEPDNTTSNSGNTSKSGSGKNNNRNTDSNYIKETPIYKVAPKDENIINILLIGRDGGRSDSMIVASYNKKTGRIVLTSFMRDSLVYIQNYGWNRLNASFAYGGPGLTINTINQIFGTDIQHFVCIDFSGFTKVIDSIGGITVNITEAESNYLKTQCNLDIPAGDATLNGSQALVYSRIRKGIGNDQARTERQRKVLTAILTKVFNEFDIAKALSLMNNSLKYVKTNLSLGDMTSLLYDFMNQDSIHIETFRVPADGTYANAYYNGMAILKVDFEKNKRLIEEKIYK
ncbi:MAG TPA: LCP family protein [Bacillota bacterium]|nr:LCP family protein [Bacillota bacterium]HOK68449.1 LCP family protein [Bacillota bacterium]HPP85083.1 LCP family protein [Bacillota bacterium]